MKKQSTKYVHDEKELGSDYTYLDNNVIDKKTREEYNGRNHYK